MNWLEIIELRTMDSNRHHSGSNLKKIIEEIHDTADKHPLKIYTRHAVEGDLSIHILHSSGEIDRTGSPFGIQLVSTLKEFGLVNHSVWIETGRK
jgi:hypothetical protein